jgi:hypothetical protein
MQQGYYLSQTLDVIVFLLLQHQDLAMTGTFSMSVHEPNAI